MAPHNDGTGIRLDPSDQIYRRSGPPEFDEDEAAGEMGYARGLSWRPWAFGAAALVMIVGAGWAGWHFLKPRAPTGDIPLIAAEPGPYKVAADSGTAREPVSDEQALETDGTGGKEIVLPPPEQPLARPAPPPDKPAPVAAAPPAPAPLAPPAALAPPPPLAAKPETTPAPKPVAKVETPAPPPKAAVPKQYDSVAALLNSDAAKPAPKSDAAAAAGGPVRIQIAATRDQATAEGEWHRLQHAHADLLSGLGVRIAKSTVEGKGDFYRVEAGPLADRAAGTALCAKLAAKGVGCFVLRPPGAAGN